RSAIPAMSIRSVMALVLLGLRRKFSQGIPGLRPLTSCFATRAEGSAAAGRRLRLRFLQADAQLLAQGEAPDGRDEEAARRLAAPQPAELKQSVAQGAAEHPR